MCMTVHVSTIQIIYAHTIHIIFNHYLNEQLLFSDSSVFSPAKSSSAVNLSGTQDPSRNKNIVKPLALSVQLVGKGFAAGMVLLSRIAESQGNYQLNSQEISESSFWWKKERKMFTSIFQNSCVLVVLCTEILHDCCCPPYWATPWLSDLTFW